MNSRRLHYAWIVLIVTFLALLTSAGIRTAPSIILKPLEFEFGWTRSETSFAVAISLFIFGFGAPLGGMLIDRFGPRRLMIGGLALVSVAMLLMAGMSQLWQFHLYWGVALGIGTGGIAGTLGATIAARWFNQRRGMVLGVFGAAAAAGQFVFVPLLIRVGSDSGWRAVIMVLAGSALAALVLTVIFMRNRPEDAKTTAFGTASAASAIADARSTPLREAIRTRDFWLLAGSFFICGYTTNGMIGTHLLPHALEHGFVETEMAGALAAMGAMNIIGSLISGALSEKFDNRKLLAAYYGFRGLSLVALPFILEIQGMFLFTIIYGFDWVATVPPTVNLTAERFGRRSLGSIYGWIYCSHMVGAGIASFAGGFFRDMLGDYHLIFISAAVMGIMASTLAMSLSRKALPIPALAAAGD
jgi:sugar phosphate permease